MYYNKEEILIKRWDNGEVIYKAAPCSLFSVDEVNWTLEALIDGINSGYSFEYADFRGLDLSVPKFGSGYAHMMWAEKRIGKDWCSKHIRFNGAKFVDTNLCGITFAPEFVEICDFTDAEIVNCDFSNCKLVAIDFSKPNFKNTKIINLKINRWTNILLSKFEGSPFDIRKVSINMDNAVSLPIETSISNNFAIYDRNMFLKEDFEKFSERDVRGRGIACGDLSVILWCKIIDAYEREFGIKIKTPKWVDQIREKFSVEIKEYLHQ